MSTLRIMSYSVDGRLAGLDDPDTSRIGRVIGAQCPDLVALQGLGPHEAPGLLAFLVKGQGLKVYGAEGGGPCCFLSRFPLRGVQSYGLGDGGSCLRADLDLAGKRIHLFNLQLSLDPRERRKQVRVVFGDELLGNPSLPCAALVCGDFSLPLWGSGQWLVGNNLQRAPLPLWRANFPAGFPLWGRDRIYFRGAIKALTGTVVTSPDARKASSHLPLVLTLEHLDTRKYMRLKDVSPGAMKPAVS